VLIQDIALLNSLGVRLVLVHGARPQIEQRLKEANTELQYVNGLRVTDDTALACVKEAVGTVRVEIEAMLSMGLASTPMYGARIRVASGNFVTARPLGVRDGIDYCHTGEVRRIDAEAIQDNLDDNSVVLLSPLGYSPTGEIFNLSAEEVATAAAEALKADKLILLVEGKGLLDARRQLIQQLDPAAAAKLLQSRRKLPEDMVRTPGKRPACGQARRAARAPDRARHRRRPAARAVHPRRQRHPDHRRDLRGPAPGGHRGRRRHPRTHRAAGGGRHPGAALARAAGDGDRPLQGHRARRQHHRLRRPLSPCASKMGELACLAVHRDYQGEGRGDVLLQAIERDALEQGLNRLFVLTTRTAHWFRERGFRPGKVEELPMQKRSMYNYQRKSKVFLKIRRRSTNKSVAEHCSSTSGRRTITQRPMYLVLSMSASPFWLNAPPR
jgi:amino-acid N-acetyltransferase